MHIRLLALSLLVAAGTAEARDAKKQPYDPGPPVILASPVNLAIAAFDRDGDYLVSRAEFDSEVRRSFKRFDRNNEGFLSLLELSAWSEATLGNMGAVPGPFDFDKDEDDKVSLDEFVAEFDRRFSALDKNGDHVLSRAELVSLTAAPLQDRRRQGRGGGNGPVPQNGQRPPDRP